MPCLLLHIGSPKAGSSAIQASLERQATKRSAWPWSSRRWRCLPANPYGRTYPSGFIAAAYLSADRLPRYLQLRQQADARAFQRDLQRYQALLHRQLQPRWRPAPAGAVLSCEYLWRLPEERILQLRRDFQARGVEQFRVIAYVREPSSLYGSALQQWARLSSDLQRFDPRQWRYELRRRLEAWGAVFGADLVVRAFEREQLHAGCVVKDLQQQALTWLGQDRWPLELMASDPVNSSTTAEALFAMQGLMARQAAPSAAVSSRRSRELGRLWERIQASADSRAGSPIRLRPEVVALIQRCHQDDLDWLASTHGVRFAQTPATAEGMPPLVAPPDRSAWSLEQLLQPPGHPELLGQLQAQLASVTLPD
jgi:hypothetical protein